MQNRLDDAGQHHDQLFGYAGICFQCSMQSSVASAGPPPGKAACISGYIDWGYDTYLNDGWPAHQNWWSGCHDLGTGAGSHSRRGTALELTSHPAWHHTGQTFSAHTQLTVMCIASGRRGLPTEFGVTEAIRPHLQLPISGWHAT